MPIANGSSDKALVLYGVGASQPVRAVQWVLAAKGIQYSFIEVMPPKGTQSPDFRKLNPMGTVPTLVDDGFQLAESHAILIYLCEKYGWTDLYPTDLQQRALVNQYLHWHHQNTRTLTLALFAPIFRPDLLTTASDTEKATKKLASTMSILEGWLSDSPYIVGQRPTIADISAYCEVGQCNEKFFDLVDFSKYPNVCAWMSRMEAVPGHDQSVAGILRLKGYADKRKAKTNYVRAKL